MARPGRPERNRAARSFRQIRRFLHVINSNKVFGTHSAQYTADGLRARWGRWLADTPEGREICRRWKEWIAAQVKKYDWDIEPDDADHPTIHGLRGTGILARAEQGYEVDQIANDIGMSRQNVEHYMRFKDQMQVAAQGQKRLRLVSNED
jgi:hypothetical protein